MSEDKKPEAIDEADLSGLSQFAERDYGARQLHPPSRRAFAKHG